MYKRSKIDPDHVPDLLRGDSKRHNSSRYVSIYDDDDDLVIFTKYSYEKNDADEERMVCPDEVYRCNWC